MRAVGQGNLERTRRQVNAGAGDGFGGISHEHVGTERVVHVVPRLLHQRFVILAVEDFQVHDDHLVRMFDVDAKAEFLEYAPLRLDHVVLESDVILVEDQRGNGATRSYLKREKSRDVVTIKI